MMLRHLGFDNLRGYPGSWSEWGNDPGAAHRMSAHRGVLQMAFFKS